MSRRTPRNKPRSPEFIGITAHSEPPKTTTVRNSLEDKQIDKKSRLQSHTNQLSPHNRNSNSNSMPSSSYSSSVSNPNIHSIVNHVLENILSVQPAEAAFIKSKVGNTLTRLRNHPVPSLRSFERDGYITPGDLEQIIQWQWYCKLERPSIEEIKNMDAAFWDTFDYEDLQHRYYLERQNGCSLGTSTSTAITPPSVLFTPPPQPTVSASCASSNVTYTATSITSDKVQHLHFLRYAYLHLTDKASIRNFYDSLVDQGMRYNIFVRPYQDISDTKSAVPDGIPPDVLEATATTLYKKFRANGTIATSYVNATALLDSTTNGYEYLRLLLLQESPKLLGGTGKRRISSVDTPNNNCNHMNSNKLASTTTKNKRKAGLEIMASLKESTDQPKLDQQLKKAKKTRNEGTNRVITLATSSKVNPQQAKEQKPAKIATPRKNIKKKSESFTEIVWPVLVRNGWRIENGGRNTDKYFMPPGVKRAESKMRKDYFDSKKQMISFIRKSKWSQNKEIMEALEKVTVSKAVSVKIPSNKESKTDKADKEDIQNNKHESSENISQHKEDKQGEIVENISQQKEDIQGEFVENISQQEEDIQGEVVELNKDRTREVIVSESRENVNPSEHETCKVFNIKEEPGKVNGKEVTIEKFERDQHLNHKEMKIEKNEDCGEISNADKSYHVLEGCDLEKRKE